MSVLLGVSYILMFFALASPTSLWVTLLSFVPPAAPIFMSMRIAEVGVPPWQSGLGMALTAVVIAGVIWLAGRLYANSAMRTGMRVPFREAFRGDATGPFGPFPHATTDDRRKQRCPGRS